MQLFLDIYFLIHNTGTVLRDMRSRFTYNISLEGLLMVLSVGCGLLAWMHWSCIDEFVTGFKTAEELYPSSPLGVDSADTSQLPKEKNLLGRTKRDTNPRLQTGSKSRCLKKHNKL
jgi:hypothetical protein